MFFESIPENAHAGESIGTADWSGSVEVVEELA